MLTNQYIIIDEINLNIDEIGNTDCNKLINQQITTYHIEEGGNTNNSKLINQSIEPFYATYKISFNDQDSFK